MTSAIKNNRVYYEQSEKPSWNDTLNKLTKGYAKTTIQSYAPFGAKKPDGTPDETSTMTKYYDKDNKLLATVFDVKSKQTSHKSISTPDADYHDWDEDGLIDSKSTNSVEKTKKNDAFIESIIKKYDKGNGIFKGVVISQIISENPFISVQDIMLYNKNRYLNNQLNNKLNLNM